MTRIIRSKKLRNKKGDEEGYVYVVGPEHDMSLLIELPSGEECELSLRWINGTDGTVAGGEREG